MKRFLLGFSFGSTFLFTLSTLLAQTTEESPSSGEAAGAIAGMGCGCIVMLVALAVWIALAIFVYKDAKSRGMDNAVLLTIVTVITGILGLVIYLLMRPKGALVACPSCGKKRLQGSATCPHCGQP